MQALSSEVRGLTGIREPVKSVKSGIHWKVGKSRKSVLPAAQPAVNSAAIAEKVDTVRDSFSNSPVSSTAHMAKEEADSVKAKAAQAVLDLKKHGWAKIEGVLPREVCEEYQNGFWDWMESLGTGVKRGDPTTWQKPHWPDSYRGIINSFEVAHQSFVWRIRKHPRIRKIFEELWGTNALLSSFDSINALPPASEIDRKAWLHVDQAPFRKGACCIQGLINLVDVSPETTGSLLVKPGTHLEHERFFTTSSETPEEELRNTGDHYQFTSNEVKYWDKFESVGVAGGAGSLFLWDSRAVHANCFPAKTRDFRHVVYTCYQPATMASPQEMEEKKRIYDNFLISTHWPGMNVAAHGNGQDYYGSGEAGVKVDLTHLRTRQLVEDEELLKLSGASKYDESETVNKKAMLDMTEEELLAIRAAAE